MSRIHDALSRARTMGESEDTRAASPDDGQGEVWTPTLPAEWTGEPAIQVPTPAPPQAVDPISSPAAPSARRERPRAWAFNPKLKEKLVRGERVDEVAAEQYRRLAAMLHLAQVERGADQIKIVMISSALSAEGKTLTCVNLALTLSESYHRSVLLVDGDLRRPWLHEVFQLPNVGGLNETLMSREAKIPIVQISEKLSLLTAGRSAADPMRVLSSPRMEHVLDEARARFDWVLLDTPPITLLSDARLLASQADLVVLVVEAGRTSYEVVQRAVDSVGRDRVAGIVLNRAKGAPPSLYGVQDTEIKRAVAPTNGD